MRKTPILILTIIILGGATAIWANSIKVPIDDGGQVMCTMEAMLCPDGSYVGRSGPKCEFAKCPVASVPTSGDLTLHVGQQGEVGDFSLTLNKIVSDSRCPIDVQCIWAGEVKVEVDLADKSGSETTSISSMGSPHLFGSHQVSIVAVTPATQSQKTISSADYKITFHVVADKKTPVGVVKGKITLSPVCPVERMPPEPACAPRPYQTSIKIFTVDGSELVKILQSQSDGTFSVSLPFGLYSFQAVGGAVYPRCGEVVVNLKAINPSPIEISCDTGIR